MNLVIVSFTPTGGGLATFTVESGVYVAGGDAKGPAVINRTVVLPTGLIYDPDGTDNAPTTPQRVWWNLEFRGSSPYAHTQYRNLLGLSGKNGTLLARLRGPSSSFSYTAAARLMAVEGEWAPPYKEGTYNALSIRVVFQMKGFWSAS